MSSGKTVKVSDSICAMCQYRSTLRQENKGRCNYWQIEGKSRIFGEGGVREVEKGYCNKFVRGKSLSQEKCGWYADRQTLIPPKDDYYWT